MGYDDVLEIVEIEKIWAARKAPPEFVRKIAIFLVVLIVSLLIFTFAAFFLFIVGSILYLLWIIRNQRMTGEDTGPSYLLLLLVLIVFFIFFLIFVKALKIFTDPQDLRYLVRFKILQPEGIEFSTSRFDPIEAVLLTLKGKERWYGKRKYKRRSPDSNQLDLIRIFLRQKYQRDVSEDECLRFFSMGMMNVHKGGRKLADEIRYSFVMLDEKTGELLFYSGDRSDWAYLSEVLGESGLFLSDISTTVIDMNKYLINEDGSITKKLTSPRVSGTNKI